MSKWYLKVASMRIRPSLILTLWVFIFSAASWSEEGGSDLRHAMPDSRSSLLVARIELHTPEEIEPLLVQAELLFDKSDTYPTYPPITMILHGPELSLFQRANYGRYKHIVALAARLDAFKVIDVKVCEAQMKIEGISADDLPAFVETVPYGPTEEQRLLKKGYQYF